MRKYQTIAFIGFGEAAQAFCEGWGDTPLLTVRAYDVKTADDTPADAKRSDYLHYGLAGCETALDAIPEANAVISRVTAARDVAAGIAPGTFFFDCNSVAPATRQTAARMRESAATAAGFSQASLMASATAEWRERHGALHLSHLRDGFAARPDAMLAVTGTSSP